MSDTNNSASQVAIRQEREALPWFKFNVARLMTERGAMEVMMSATASGALLKFMLHSWVNGPVPEDKLARICGEGGEILRDAMLEQDAQGNWVLPYLERERHGQAVYQEKRAAAGRASATVRSARVEHQGTYVEHMPNHKRRVEKNREPESDSGSSEASPPPHREPRPSAPVIEETPKPRKPNPDAKKGEHVQLVEMFQRAWAELRCHDALVESGFKITRETDPRTIPPAARYEPAAQDWAAAARLWKQIGGDVGLARARMRNFFLSDAPYMRAGGFSLFASKFSVLIDPIKALNNSLPLE